MAGYKINLDSDIHLPVPFDLLFCGRRETIDKPALLKLTPDDASPIAHNRIRLYIDRELRYEGHTSGGAQFGEFRRTATGKTEVWLDPQYVRYVE